MLLIIFLIVWICIAVYLFSIDRKIGNLKKNLKFREKLKD
jgi:CcmD family protein